MFVNVRTLFSIQLDTILTRFQTKCIMEYQDFDCHNHPVGLKLGSFTDGDKEQYRDGDPRVSSISHLNADYNPFSVHRRHPTHSAARALKHRLNSSGESMYDSLVRIQTADMVKSVYADIPRTFSGSVHGLSAMPQFAVSFYNVKSVKFALKIGRSTNLGWHIDSAEGVVQNVDDHKIITTEITVPSPARKESIIVFEMHTISRYGVEFKTHFERFYSFLEHFNGGPPTINIVTMDCYSLYTTFLCLKLNGFPVDRYLQIHWKRLRDNVLEHVKVNTVLNQCGTHIHTDVKTKIKGDEALKGQSKKRAFLLSLTWKSIQQVIESISFDQCMDIMNGTLILLSTEHIDVSNECPVVIGGGTTVNVSRSGVFGPDLMQYVVSYTWEHDDTDNTFTANIQLRTTTLVIVLYQQVQGVLGVVLFGGNTFYFECTDAVITNRFSTPLLFHPPLAKYLIENMFKKAPLYMKQCKRHTERHSNATSEAQTRNDRNQPIGVQNRKQRLDDRIEGRIRYQDGIYSRFFDECKAKFTKTTKEKRKTNNVQYDRTSKRRTSEGDARLHELFMKWRDKTRTMKREDRVADYEKMKRSDPKLTDGPTLSVTHITKLANRYALPDRNGSVKNWKEKVEYWLKKKLSE